MSAEKFCWWVVGRLLLYVSSVVCSPFVHADERHTFGDGSPVPDTARAFANMQDEVAVSWDDAWVYIRTDSIPQHRMMVGIKAWNQQVPIRHDLEFKLPIKPRLRDTPGPTTLIGPVAIAVNGIPIFDPTTQGGRHDAFEHGELDEFGGHAGRADDYHYHIAPFHLMEKVGAGQPIAFGLDGLPVYPKSHGELDEAHGHFHEDGSYHYHGTHEKPYHMSGFRGEVDLDARPRTKGVRPYTRPLRGATITDFMGSLEDGFTLTYELGGQVHRVEYQVQEDGGVNFVFVDPNGVEQAVSYARKSGGDHRKRPKGERGKRRKK